MEDRPTSNIGGGPRGRDHAPTSDGGPAVHADRSGMLLEKPGDTIGRFKLLTIIGTGGFGVVWLADQVEPIQRRVALKIVKVGMDTEAFVARFEQERQALALLDHPNIARIFDAGATDTGRPYFVMEHIAGEPLTEYCDRQKLDIRQRLELFIPICEAVYHAHGKGIIHRDIKPQNILVTVKDGRPIPKIIDFGVAKAVSHELTAKSIFTEYGQIIGTPEYMSPEQAETGTIDIDGRTDVYSLGATLYEVLTGVCPFDSRELRSKAYAEIQRIIREVDPPKPSTRVSKLAERAPARPMSDVPDDKGIEWALEQAQGVGPRRAEVPSAAIAKSRRTDIQTLVHDLKAELEWIPIKAMRKDRIERYRDPIALADDIRNYLESRPLAAGPETVTYRTRKYLRKNRTRLAVSLLVLLLAGGAVLGASAAWVSRRHEREQADRAAHLQSMMTDILGAGRTSPGEGAPILKARSEQLDRGEGSLVPAERLAVGIEIAHQYHLLGEDEEAAKRYRALLRSLAEAIPPDAEAIERVKCAIVDPLRSLGNLDEAMILADEAIASAESRTGRSSVEAALCWMTKATLLYDRGDLKQAMERCDLALSTLETEAPRRFSEIGRGLANMAVFLQNQNEFERAIRAARRARDLARQIRVDGGDPISIANRTEILGDANNVLAGSLDTLGRWEEAIEAYQQAIDIFAGAPDRAGDVVLTRTNLALAFVKAGRFDDAESAVREVLTASAAVKEPPDPAMIQTLGVVLRERGDTEGAIAKFQEALQAVPAGDAGAEQRRSILIRWADALARAGRLDDASAKMAQARALLGGLFKDGDSNRWYAASIEGEIESRRGRFAVAEPLIVESFNALKDRAGVPGWYKSRMALRAAELFKSSRRPDDEAKWRRMVDSIGRTTDAASK